MIDGLEALAETDIGIEIARIGNGEAWCSTHVAGLQFYSYDDDDGLDGRVRPVAGDRLHLVRQPENLYDRNAIEVWWRNEYRLGHVPRELAAEIAGNLDAGISLRAYVWNGGDGSAWSLDMMLIGEPVRARHTDWIENEARIGVRQIDRAAQKTNAPWRRRSEDDARRFEVEARDRRQDRLTQAVAAFSKMAWEPDLPSVGESVHAERLADCLACSVPTAWKLIGRAGIEKVVFRRGYYAYAQPISVTSALLDVCREFCLKPRAMSAAVVKDRARIAA